MIFPILNLYHDFLKAPVTWLLVLLNVAVFLYTSNVGVRSQKHLDKLMADDFFVRTQGEIYADYLKTHAAPDHSQFISTLGRKVRQGETDRDEILGYLSFRDLAFLQAAPSLSYPQDVVAFRFWKRDLKQVQVLESEHPSFTLGLNAQDESLTKWVTYIFVHSGWLHLIGNMLFLVIFGAALEVQEGGLGLLVVFLLSGIMGAGTFALMSGVSVSPLVGASGAISGVMTLYCVLNWRKPQRFLYWFFLPFREFLGTTFFPAWVVTAIWVTGDLAGYFSTVPELGAVAHTAHLGGELAGALAGLTLLALRRLHPQTASASVAATPPMGKLVPFFPPLRPSVLARYETAAHGVFGYDPRFKKLG